MTTETSWPWVDLPPGPAATPSAALAERYLPGPAAPTTMPSGDSAPLVVRHDDVRAILACPASSRTFREGDPVTVTGMTVESLPNVLINMDGPEHLRLRRIVAGPFSPRQIERWRPAIGQLAGEVLDGIGSRFDVVEHYALPLSCRAICMVLGVPSGDYLLFHNWTQSFLSTSSASTQARVEAWAALVQYAADLVAQHRDHPGEDLIDQLIEARDEQDRLSEEELISMMIMLIGAGQETLATMISRAVYRLLHTGHYAQLAEDPSLIAAAVEEILRYDGPGNYGLLRRLTETLALPSGEVIPAGAVVLPSPYFADHDPTAFPDPHVFDVRRFARTDTRPHLAFGHGPHFCLGAALARVELQEALRALLGRWPGLRPAIALDEVVWTDDGLNHRPRSLPVIA